MTSRWSGSFCSTRWRWLSAVISALRLTVHFLCFWFSLDMTNIDPMILMFVWGVRQGSRQAMPHTSPATRLTLLWRLPTMLAVCPVTSPIAAFAWSQSSPDAVTGMPEVLLAPGHGHHPVQTSSDQVYRDMLNFFIAHYICLCISNFRPNKSKPHLFMCISHLFVVIQAKNDI